MNVLDRAMEQAALSAEPLDIKIYDGEFKKEGNDWFLRIFIYKESGVSLDDCEAVSLELGRRLDLLDFIDRAYYLEVSSSGIERVLKQDWHFDSALNQKIRVKLFSSVHGAREHIGLLTANSCDDITLDGNITIKKDLIAKANVYIDF